MTALPVATAFTDNSVTEGQFKAAMTDLIANIYERPAVRNFLDGFIMAPNATFPTTRLDIGAGSCNNFGNTHFINLPSLVTKRFDATWAEGSNNGGLPSALTLGPNQLYSVFVIGKPDGTSDAGIDTSPTAANLLFDASAYSHYRRVGYAYTDGSNLLVPFTQKRGFISLNARIFSGQVTGTVAASTIGLAAPPNTTARIIAEAARVTAGTAVLITAISEDDQAPTSDLETLKVSASNDTSVVSMDIEVDASSNIRHRSSNTNAELRFWTLGWEDARGQE